MSESQSFSDGSRKPASMLHEPPPLHAMASSRQGLTERLGGPSQSHTETPLATGSSGSLSRQARPCRHALGTEGTVQTTSGQCVPTTHSVLLRVQRLAVPALCTPSRTPPSLVLVLKAPRQGSRFSPLLRYSPSPPVLAEQSTPLETQRRLVPRPIDPIHLQFSALASLSNCCSSSSPSTLP